MEYLNGQDCSLLLTATGTERTFPPRGLWQDCSPCSGAGLRRRPPALPLPCAQPGDIATSKLRLVSGSTEIS